MKKIFQFIPFFFLFYFMLNSANANNYTPRLDTCEKCTVFFLGKELAYTKGISNFIYVPVTIGKSKVRLVINSEDLHHFLSILILNNDSELIDTGRYFKKVESIILGKEEFIFNPSYFAICMHHSHYTILDKENPYITEIEKSGLAFFLKKRMNLLTIRGDKVYYGLIDLPEYDNYNQYSLIYLYEALFNYNLSYLNGDGQIEFSKEICLCNGNVSN